MRSLVTAAVMMALPLAVHAEEAEFSIKVDPPAAAQAKKAAVAKVSLHAGKGMHVNEEFPTALTVEVPAGVESAKKVKPAKIDKVEALFDVEFTAQKAGKAELKGTLAFVVCDDGNTKCVPHHEPVKIAVNVK